MKQNLKYWSVALLGGAVGALAGVLLAPASGRETRRTLSRRFGDEKDALVRRGHRAVEEVADYLQDQLHEGKKKLAEAVNA
jgi:gas vesicle protein